MEKTGFEISQNDLRFKDDSKNDLQSDHMIFKLTQK